MNNKMLYSNILPTDIDTLTHIMTLAFNEDTSIHTDLAEDGPKGYNDGSLITWLCQQQNFESYKISYGNEIIGAYTVGIKQDQEYSLEMFFIDPNYRGNHFGTIIWKDIEQNYVNANKWTVETPDYSTRNHHFYTIKCGFKISRENIYEDGSKSYVFEKQITL